MLGNGEKQTSLCFIQDVIDAFILAAESEKANGKTYKGIREIINWYQRNNLL
ncbi:MAG: hypothetical protein ACOC6P_00115 [Candidatus Aminicenantaceae bacterium]